MFDRLARRVDRDQRLVVLGALAGLCMVLSNAVGRPDLVKFAAVPALALAVLSPVSALATFGVIAPFPEVTLYRVVSYPLTLALAVLVGCLARLALADARLRLRVVVVAILAYLFICGYQYLYVAGTVDVSRVRAATYQFAQVATGLLLLLAAAYVSQRGGRRVVLGLLVGSAVAASLLGLVSLNPNLVDQLDLRSLIPSRDLGGRASGPFQSINYFGLFAALGLALAVGLPMAKSGVWRAMHVGAIGVIALGLISSMSRGALIAAGVGVVTAIGLRYGRRAGLIAVLVAGVVVLIGYPALMTWRLTTTFGPDLVGANAAQAESDQWRLEMAIAGLRMFRSSPLLGVGFGQFHYVSPEYLQDVPLTYSHNWYVNVLAEQGLLGAISYGLLILAIGFALIRSAGRYRAASLAVLMTFLFGSLVAEPVSSFQTTGIFWIVSGIGLASYLFPQDPVPLGQRPVRAGLINRTVAERT